MTREELRACIEDYINGLETNLTDESCLCEWIEMETAFGIRKIKSTVSLECPVHTREGLILAFVDKHFTFMIERTADADTQRLPDVG